MAEKILIISPVPLFPGHAGNRERIRAICAELMSRGYCLDFFYTGFYQEISDEHATFFSGRVLDYALEQDRISWSDPMGRVQEIINGLNVKASRIGRRIKDGADSAAYNRSLSAYKNLSKKRLLKSQVGDDSYKAVIVNYAPYSFYFDLFDKDTIKIIDTHDRLTDRYKLFTENNQTPVDWHSLRYKDEKRALSKADLIWAITDQERMYFSSMLAREKTEVHTLRHLLPYNQINNQTSTKRIVMIGSANRLNIDGLTWFLEQVWKKITHYELDLKFLLSGSICEAVDETLFDDNVELYGRFDSPDEIYSKGDLFINPMQGGTGLKIKTFEALASGKFVLSTEAGATGLAELVGHGLICSDDSSVWIREIKSFFNDDAGREDDRKKLEAMIGDIYRENLDVITRSLAEKSRSG